MPTNAHPGPPPAVAGGLGADSHRGGAGPAQSGTRHEFRYSQPGRRKALFVGINYFGQRGQLRNCINDVRNMSTYLPEHFGYKREDMVILTDDQQSPMSQPTKANLLRAMHWLVEGARPNDSLFFHYSGYSGEEGHKDADEDADGKSHGQDDGYYETIYPVDFRQVGHITDDEMHRIMVKPLRPGVRLTAIFDSCHPGTAIDLPYIYSTQGTLKEPNFAKEGGQGLLGVISPHSQGYLGSVVNNIMGVFDKTTNPEQPWVPRPPTRGDFSDAASSVMKGLQKASGQEQPHAQSLSAEPPAVDPGKVIREHIQKLYRIQTELDSRYRLPDETVPDTYRYQAAASALGPSTDSGYASGIHTKDKWQPRIEQTTILATQQQSDDDSEDIATVYSDTSSMASSRQENYIWDLASDLFEKVSSWNPDSQTKERISTALPDLLKTFALKIGHDGESQIHRNVMVYVHKYRHKIAESFTGMYSQQDDNSVDTTELDSENMPLQDKMNLWFGQTLKEFPRIERELVDLDLDDIDSEGTAIPGAGTAEEYDGVDPTSTLRDLVSRSEAYEWLLTGLQREFCLTSTESTTIQKIGQKITSSLPSIRRISRKTRLGSFSVRFDLDWDPYSFLSQQQYAVNPAEAVKGAITLTGTSQDAQAATCLEYMKQTWRLTGESTLRLVSQVIDGESGVRHTCHLSDGTELWAWTDRSRFFVEVSGVGASIAEVGEQLAWLGAALQASPLENGLIYATPTVIDICTNNMTPQTNSMSPPRAVYEIGFIIEEIVHPQFTNGQCWHDVFRNPVIVKGYPIPRRDSPDNSGLEVRLNILAGLARTQRIDCFKEKVILKGFSTMLIPTKMSKDIICWHLIYSKDGSRISYLDDTVAHEARIKHSDLENVRHVLGWCPEAQFYGGSAQATCPVSHAGLPRAHGDCALSNIFVSAGRLITGGPPFYIGAKDTPIHVPRSGYIPRLKWISTKFVLLWDEADKRGWLINGTSALLHVVRASLEHDGNDKFKSAFVFKSEELQESSTPFTPDSAVDVLINANNMNLKLYPEKNGYLTLESRIDHYCNIIEKLIDHQAEVAGYCGIKIADKPRRNLEGWDFTDLVTNRDPLHPRVATIETRGKGWVDFTRAIHAVTFVGHGFGEIIRPAGTDICEYWSRLPRQEYYLAICLSDLSQMIAENDHHGDTHVRLSENIIWHTPTTKFGLCQCRGVLGSGHREPVQTLLPSSLGHLLFSREQPIRWGSKGAVIFGHNSAFRWVWGDTGPPEEKELPPSYKIYDADSFEDSGVGSSLASSELERPKSINRANTQSQARSSAYVRPDAAVSEDRGTADDEPRNRRDYAVGILCALPKELMAVRALFDRRHDNVDIPQDDSNHYALGEIGHHMVVAACLPDGEYGTNSAAHSVSNMNRSFPSLRLGFCLLVGIGGGAPSEEHDIRLGDVVVSLPTRTYPGVIQYDRGKEKENTSFERTGSLAPPPRCLMSAISSLRSDPDLPSDPLRPYLEKIASRLPTYRHPGQDRDQLSKTPCSICEAGGLCPNRDDHIVKRNPRSTDQPHIHYGLIASGNRVLKDSKVRDTLAREHGVLCFEMEAAGVFNAGLGCLVIRGISDYADAMKNKDWQEYAAASAAAYAKLLLGVVTNKEVIDDGNRGNNGNRARLSVTPARRTGSSLDEDEGNEHGRWKRQKR
ncbi:hypothetical protein F5Y10DRAFT_197377 [Nemania abortiva]|nr:hypothetical protein F5Y10DRAFT_197377 [Nemania abortiva]